LTTPFSSIVSLPVSASRVLLKTGLSPISPIGLSQSLPAPLPFSYYLHLVVFPKALSSPILFTIYVLPIASIVSSHGVNQQQNADDTQLFVFLSLHLYLAVSAASSGVSSLHSWFIHNGLVLNPSKTEAICFGTNPRLQSLSHLTSIEVMSTSVSLVDYIKLLGVTFDKHLNLDKNISNVCSSSYFHIRALRHNRPFLDLETSKTTACAIVGSR